jgi:LPPG:FO 2-phospho-L-lactate transferase
MASQGSIIALTGGIGGAKLALGLVKSDNPHKLTFVVNTGDDFNHLGMHISPDIDTLVYTLSGQNNSETGWGRKDESWDFMTELKKLGGEDWFNLGDKDLALHHFRTASLNCGLTLTQVTEIIKNKFDIACQILPMCDQPVMTMVDSDMGRLPFQHYFVKHQCKPSVAAITFEGAQNACLGLNCATAFKQEDLELIIICPSNPYLSVDPILSVPGMLSTIRASSAPVIVISPIVGDKAIKGPTAKIMSDLAIPVDVLSIAKHYKDIADGIIIDSQDHDLTDEVSGLIPDVMTTNIIMHTLQDRIDLANTTLEFARSIKTNMSQNHVGNCTN